MRGLLGRKKRKPPSGTLPKWGRKLQDLWRALASCLGGKKDPAIPSNSKSLGEGYRDAQTYVAQRVRAFKRPDVQRRPIAPRMWAQ